jgi:hypothetical protein
MPKGEGGHEFLGGFGLRYRLGSHAEIFFRGGGDLIIFPKSNNSNVRTFAVRPSRKRFQTLARSLCRPSSSRGKTLRIYFPTGGGLSKVPGSRTQTVRLLAAELRTFRDLFFPR